MTAVWVATTDITLLHLTPWHLNTLHVGHRYILYRGTDTPYTWDDVTPYS